MRVNASSMSLIREEMTNLKSLRTKYEKKTYTKFKCMGFCHQIYQRIKLKKDALPFRRTYGSMSFKKKIVKDLEGDDLVETTHSDWAAPSLLVSKKLEPIAWF